MKKVTQIIDRTSDIFGVIAGILMVLGVVLVVVEIIMRSVFNGTIYITQEYNAYFMVGITFFGLAYTLKEKGHIRLTFLHKFIKVGKGRAMLEIYASIIGLIIFIIVTMATWELFFNSYINGSRSMQLTKTFIAIPQFAMPLGSFLISLQFVSEIVKQVLQLKSGEYEEDNSDQDALGR